MLINSNDIMYSVDIFSKYFNELEKVKKKPALYVQYFKHSEFAFIVQ